MDKRYENGTVYITLPEKLDYEAALAADAEIISYLDQLNEGTGEEGAPSAIVLDAAGLSYTSSAGIRLLLKIKKRISNMRMLQVSDEVYDTICITGMEDLFGLEPVNAKETSDSFDPVFATEPAKAEEPGDKPEPEQNEETDTAVHQAQLSDLDFDGINDSRADAPFIPVTKSFEAQVAQHADEIAVTSSKGRYTYRQLNEAANRIANLLIYAGVGAEDVVAIMLSRGIEVYAATLGILKAGAAYTIVNPKYPDERIEYIYKDAGCKFIISSKDMVYERLELFVDLLQKRPLFFEHLMTWENTANPDVQIHQHDLCYLIYTSGSTGNPKGVMIEHGNLSNFLLDVPQNHEFQGLAKKCTCCLAMAQLTFDFSIMEQYIPLVSGKRVALALYEEIANPNRMIDFMNENEVDGACFTPSYLSGLLKLPSAAPAISRLKVIDFGAEAFPGTLYTKIRELNPDVHIMNGYGPTEATISCTMKVIQSPENITIGKPNANVYVFAVDENGQVKQDGETGELLICGDGVGRGYVNLKEKTQEAFVPFHGMRAYKSGDLVRINADQEIEYLGRKDFQVKIRGLRIELGEVESTLSAMPGIDLCVATSHKDQYLCFYYTSQSGVSEEEIRAYAKEHMAHYMIPDIYIQLAKMPMTANQKIDRKALPEPVVMEKAVTPAETPDQQKLLDILHSVMTEGHYGIDQNLMEIGMSSLDIMLFLSLLGENYDVGMGIGELNDHPTIRELDLFIKKAPKVKKHVKKDKYPALMLQVSDYFATIGGEGNLNIPTVYELPVSVDNDRLKEAIYQTIAVHPGLTVRFEQGEDGALYQIPQSDFRDYEIQTTFMQDADYDAGKMQISKRFASDDKWLFRFEIIETPTRKFLFTDYSHLNSDGTSVSIVIEDILAAYAGKKLDGEVMTQLELGDYMYDFWETKAGKRCIDLYMLTLQDVGGPITLPANLSETSWKPRRVVKQLQFNATRFHNYCGKYHLTESSVLTCALGIVFAKIMKQKSVAFSYGFSGRNDSRLRNTVGYVASVLEVCVHTEENYLETMQRFMKDLINLMMYPTMPVEQVVSTYPNALDIVFLYQPGAKEALQIEGHPVKEEFLQDVMPNEIVKTVFQVLEQEDGSFLWEIDYHGNLYSEGFIQSILTDVDQVIGDILKEGNV